MSADADRWFTTCCPIIFGLITISIGYFLHFIAYDPISESIFLAVLGGGILMIVIGAALIPSSIRTRRRNRSIYEIVGIRKKVTITEISSETGLDYEFVQKVMTEYLLSGYLYGYLEDDLFVRDIGGRRRYSSDLSRDDD